MPKSPAQRVREVEASRRAKGQREIRVWVLDDPEHIEAVRQLAKISCLGRMPMEKDKLIEELRSALHATLEWIDAVPAETFKALPAMPGFDRDWADGLLEDQPAEED